MTGIPARPTLIAPRPTTKHLRPTKYTRQVKSSPARSPLTVTLPVTSPIPRTTAKLCSEQGTVDVSFSGASPELVNRYLPPVEQSHGVDVEETSNTSSPHLNVVIHVVGSRGELHMVASHADSSLTLTTRRRSTIPCSRCCSEAVWASRSTGNA